MYYACCNREDGPDGIENAGEKRTRRKGERKGGGKCIWMREKKNWYLDRNF